MNEHYIEFHPIEANGPVRVLVSDTCGTAVAVDSARLAAILAEGEQVDAPIDERARFEAWISNAMPDLLPLTRNFGDYQRVGTQMAWDAWQARALLV